MTISNMFPEHIFVDVRVWVYFILAMAKVRLFLWLFHKQIYEETNDKCAKSVARARWPCKVQRSHEHLCSTAHKLLILKHNTTHSTQQLQNNYCKLFCQASFFLLNTFNFPFWHEDRRAISVFWLNRMQNVYMARIAVNDKTKLLFMLAVNIFLHYLKQWKQKYF